MLILPEDYHKGTAKLPSGPKVRSASGPQGLTSRTSRDLNGDRPSMSKRPSLNSTATTKPAGSTTPSIPATIPTHKQPAASQTAIPDRQPSLQPESQPQDLPVTDQRPSSSHHSLTDDGDSMASISTGVSDDLGPDLDVLAALASLGISESVRATVQQALDQLDAAAQSAGLPSTSYSAGNGNVASPGGGRGVGGGPVDKKRVEELEKKLSMSRSIMRKLYHRNVELEKEMQVLKANTTGIISFTVSTSELLAKRQASRSLAGQQQGDALDGLVAQALQERDATVFQLQQALDAARRRCSLLESQVLVSGSGSGGSGGVRSSSIVKGGSHANAKDILAQSHLHYNKYRQIRDDYNRLLTKRAGNLAMNKGTSAVARSVVSDMRARLQQEMTEREAEAALYSAKLYETERQMSDWYVEKRMLEEHISQLSADIAHRDQLDAEIESCMCGLFERLKQLEAANEQLRQQLGQEPASPACCMHG